MMTHRRYRPRLLTPYARIWLTGLIQTALWIAVARVIFGAP